MSLSSLMPLSRWSPFWNGKNTIDTDALHSASFMIDVIFGSSHGMHAVSDAKKNGTHLVNYFGRLIDRIDPGLHNGLEWLTWNVSQLPGFR